VKENQYEGRIVPRGKEGISMTGLRWNESINIYSLATSATAICERVNPFL
jgi:hypothetical protein